MHTHKNDLLLSIRELSESVVRKALGDYSYRNLDSLDTQDFFNGDLAVVVHEVASATLDDFLEEMVSVAKPFGIREICCLLQQFYYELTEEPAVILVSRGGELLLVKVSVNPDLILGVVQLDVLEHDSYRVFSIEG
jgi:hypothetical protein